MPPLISVEETNALDSGDESDDEPMSMEMLEDICERSQSHLNVNRIKARYKIYDIIKQIQLELKGALKDTRGTDKVLHKVFKTVVKEIFTRFTTFGRIWFIILPFHPRTQKLCEVTKLSDDITKPWIKATQKEIKNLINNQTFLVEDPKKGGPVTPCMDVYKAKISLMEFLTS